MDKFAVYRNGSYHEEYSKIFAELVGGEVDTPELELDKLIAQMAEPRGRGRPVGAGEDLLNAQREHAYLLRMQGLTFRQIAAKMNLPNAGSATTRVYTWCKTHNLDIPKVKHDFLAFNPDKDYLLARSEHVWLLRVNDKLSFSEMSVRLGVSASRARGLFVAAARRKRMSKVAIERLVRETQRSSSEFRGFRYGL